MRPRSERRVSLEILQPAKRANEHILSEIAGVLMVANKSIAQLIDVTLMPLHQRIERVPTARQARRHELGIGLIGDRHLIAGLGVLGT